MLKEALLYLIKFYKQFISPVTAPSCRYYPTCSTYMLEALTKYGILKGVLLGVKRILRCHPLGKGGIDLLK